MQSTRRMLGLAISIGVGALMIPGPARGGSITQTLDFSIDAFGNMAFVALQAAEFNPSMGTLTSVDFGLTYTTSGVSYGFQNQTSSPLSLQVQDDEQRVGFVGPDVGFNSPYAILHSPETVTLDPYSGTQGYTGTDALMLNEVGSVNYSNSDVASSASLTPYIGTGSQEIDLFGSELVGAAWVSPAGAAAVTQGIIDAGTTTGSLTVTYTFTAASVPEPSTAVLVGSLGVVLLGYRSLRPRRRRPGPTGRD
jgi:hypothetical protein